METIIIGCDNAAVDLKNEIKKYLGSMKIEIEDVGCSSKEDPTMYPLVAEKVCRKIEESGFRKEGILCCGTGIGMCMSANKCRGIRAAVCHDSYSAERARLSNNSNVLCMGARVIGVELAKKIVGEWVSLHFVDSPSTAKVNAIIDIENRNFR